MSDGSTSMARVKDLPEFTKRLYLLRFTSALVNSEYNLDHDRFAKAGPVFRSVFQHYCVTMLAKDVQMNLLLVGTCLHL